MVARFDQVKKKEREYDRLWNDSSEMLKSMTTLWALKYFTQTWIMIGQKNGGGEVKGSQKSEWSIPRALLSIYPEFHGSLTKTCWHISLCSRWPFAVPGETYSCIVDAFLERYFSFTCSSVFSRVHLGNSESRAASVTLLRWMEMTLLLPPRPAGTKEWMHAGERVRMRI